MQVSSVLMAWLLLTRVVYNTGKQHVTTIIIESSCIMNKIGRIGLLIVINHKDD